MDQNEYVAKITQLEEQHQFELSKVSHEIRNPVTLINSFLQLIVSQHPEIANFEYWDKVVDNMDFLKSLLNEISNYNNSRKLHMEEVNIHHFLESIISDLNVSLSSRHIAIALKKETALPPMPIDVTKMKEVVLNLLRNSCEAIQENGTVEVLISCDGNDVFIRIKDDGPGIPEEYMDTLFTPFVTHKRDGTGLGLAIVKNVITAHNGSIHVESNPTSGTVFTITLPI